MLWLKIGSVWIPDVVKGVLLTRVEKVNSSFAIDKMEAVISGSGEGCTKAPLPAVAQPGENISDQVMATGEGTNEVVTPGNQTEPAVSTSKTEPTADVAAGVQESTGTGAPETVASETGISETGSPIVVAPEAVATGTPMAATPENKNNETETTTRPIKQEGPTPGTTGQPQGIAEPTATEANLEESTLKTLKEDQGTSSEIAPTPQTEPVTEVQPTPETKPEPVKEEKLPTEIGAGPLPDESQPALNGDDWKKRETELLSTIADLEKLKTDCSTDGLALQLKVKDEEIDILKSRIKTLETELAAALTKPGAKNHEVIEKIKEQHEELLNKAKGMIFDKTKMVKNQELQIQALTSQVASLKDVASITKDLLEIRNAEVKHLEERLEAMDGRFKAERERHNLMLKRSENNTKINDDLKKEYETQLALFKELRDKYEQRVKALVTENEKLQDLLKAHNEAKEQK